MPNDWDGAADAYAASPQVDWFDDLLERHVLAGVAGKRVLDLGCGHGWFAAELHRRGAEVHAVDGSRRLLEIARAEHPGPTYEHVDLAEVGIAGAYDVVVALMVLMDLPTLARIRPRTPALVATMLHPAFYLQKTVDEPDGGGYRQVRGYLEPATWRIEAFGGHEHFHRPLGAYVEWLASLGLGVTELFEPPAFVYEGWRRDIPTRLGLAAYRIARRPSTRPDDP